MIGPFYPARIGPFYPAQNGPFLPALTSVRQDLNLHYVGLTRAKDVCYIMNGSSRYRRKQNDFISAEPSPFLNMPGLAERRYDVIWK